jgi:hypothetical protein
MNLARTVSVSPNVPQRRRFTVDEYDRLTELGIWGVDDRIELIDGEIIQMVAKGTAHIRLGKQVECHSQPQQNAQGDWLYGLRQVVLPPQMLALPMAMVGAIDVGACF